MAQVFGDSFDRERQEAEIRAVEAAYDAAWQAGDINGLLSCLTKDAVLVNPRGKAAKGHFEIRKEFEQLFGGPAAGSTHTSRVVRIEFVSPSVSIVDGEAVVDMAVSDNPSTGSFSHRFTDVLVRNQDGWAIAHIRAYVVMTGSSDDIG